MLNKIVLITGASSGIGESCARVFAREGAKLILAARRIERLEKLAADYRASQCYIAELDVRDRDAVNRFIETLPSEFSGIDILVNNAGLARGLEPVYQGNHVDWDEMIDTNVKGLLNVTRAVLQGMVTRRRGHVINIGSIAGRMVYPNGVVYCATKFAVRALSQGLIMELVDTPIRVTTVDPGLVETEFSKVRFHGDEDLASAPYMGLTPLTADDVAESIIFCATRPPHVNISEMVVLPTDQASPYHVHRQE